jgi:hypothetical protein
MNLPSDIQAIVASYIIPMPMKLRDWVDVYELDWECLSLNPAAIDLLRANPDKIDWWRLSGNPAAIDLLRANPDKVDWEWLSKNPAIFERDLQLHRRRCAEWAAIADIKI